MQSGGQPSITEQLINLRASFPPPQQHHFDVLMNQLQTQQISTQQFVQQLNHIQFSLQQMNQQQPQIHSQLTMNQQILPQQQIHPQHFATNIKRHGSPNEASDSKRKRNDVLMQQQDSQISPQMLRLPSNVSQPQTEKKSTEIDVNKLDPHELNDVTIYGGINLQEEESSFIMANFEQTSHAPFKESPFLNKDLLEKIIQAEGFFD